MDKPTLIKGDIAIDNRGQLQFINALEFDEVKRFYIVSNHEKHFIRAWHGHKNEGKYCIVITGEALVSTVKIDNWDKPSHNLQPEVFVLSEKKPCALYIPPGYANGFMTLTEGAKLMFLSTSTLEESKTDDYRFNYDYWHVWNIDYR